MAIRTSSRTSRDGTRVGSAPGAPAPRAERPARSRGAEPNSPIKRVRTLVRDTMTEIRKVSWPDTQTTRNLTLAVIGTATALGLLLGGIDALFVRLWEWVP